MASSTSSTSTTEDSVSALKKTQQALVKIQARLQPFLQALQPDDDDDGDNRDTTTSKPDPTTTTTTKKRKRHRYTNNERALSRAAIALSIATIRVMSARLQGSDQGQKRDDPLRQELNRIRTVLVATQQKCIEERKTSNNHNNKDKQSEQQLEQPRKGDDDSAADEWQQKMDRQQTSVVDKRKNVETQGSEESPRKRTKITEP